jgi:hypothetical protein
MRIGSIAVIGLWLAVGCGSSSAGGDGGTDDGGDASVGDAGTPDGATVVDGAVCLPPPVDGNTAMSCAAVTWNAIPGRFTLGVPDPSAPGGGQRLELQAGMALSAGGHTYSWSNGDAQIANGAGGDLSGDVYFTVDGLAQALHYHFEGCLTQAAGGKYAIDMLLVRSDKGCPSCTPAAEGRHYTATLSVLGGAPNYVFVADDPPRGCGFSYDLLGMTLPGM